MTGPAIRQPTPLDRIQIEHRGDDLALLRVLRLYIEEGDSRLRRARAVRLEAVLRLRKRGVGTAAVARAAGVSESLLSRSVIQAGAPRRKTS